MGTRVNWSGLVVAGIGFFLTRFTVTLALYETPLQFYLAGVTPLLLGLGLAIFGVALAVADVDPLLVRTTAQWCVIGAATMLALVILTLVGSTPTGMPALATVRSQTYLANFLIGGSVGGTLTGLYAARTRRQRDQLRQQTRRLVVLNRILRHEVLNAVNVIRGYATIDSDDRSGAGDIIDDRSATIERTIENVTYLTKTARPNITTGTPINLPAALAASVDTIRTRYPAATISVDNTSDTLPVRANEHLEQAFTKLLENAITHADTTTPTVEISVRTTASTVRVSIADEGPGLPERQRALLEDGRIEEFDDPGTGFGLNIVRLLVESYGGTIETTVSNGTTVTIVLPRAESQELGVVPSQSGLVGVRPAVPHLLVTLGAAVLAGVPYGIVAEQLGGSVAAIGVFYGVENAVVGWLTHEFHSAVFAFVFAGFVSFVPSRYRNRVGPHVALGIGWAFVLWLAAAGIVAPVWLRLLGIPAPIPNLSSVLLVSHLAWGITLGGLTAVGYQYVSPWIAKVSDRVGGFRHLSEPD